MGFESQPLTTQSLARQIAEQLRDAIVAGHLGADERLPGEEQLAKQFGVSRPTVREALKRLAAQHLIRSRRGPAGGTFVNRPTLDELRDGLTGAVMVAASMGEFDTAHVAEARRELETLCCRLAVRHRSQQDLDAMAEEIRTQKNESLSDEDFCASDVRLHRLLVDASGNRVMQFMMCAVIEALQPVFNLAVYRFRDRKRIVAQHEQLVAALRNRDTKGALATLAEQMSYLDQQLAAAQAARAKNS